jgi:hypothetical protein
MTDEKNLSSEDFFNGDHIDLEVKLEPLKISFLINGELEQEYCLSLSNFIIS